MSARFGRNQRRKLQEAVKARDKEIERLTHVARGHYDQMLTQLKARQAVERDLLEWARRIVMLLGDTTAFAREMAVHNIDAGLFVQVVDDGRPYRIGIEPPETWESLRPGAAVAIDFASRVIDLFAVCAGQENDRVQYRHLFEIRGPDGGRALVVDERTLSQLRQHRETGLIRYLHERLVEPWIKEGRRPR